MTDERLAELGNRLLEIDRESRTLKNEKEAITEEVLDHMQSLGVKWLRRGGLSFTMKTRLYGRQVSPFITVGRVK